MEEERGRKERGACDLDLAARRSPIAQSHSHPCSHHHGHPHTTTKIKQQQGQQKESACVHNTAGDKAHCRRIGISKKKVRKAPLPPSCLPSALRCVHTFPSSSAVLKLRFGKSDNYHTE